MYGFVVRGSHTTSETLALRAIADAWTIGDDVQICESVHVLPHQACLQDCGSDRTIGIHFLDQWHRLADSAPIAVAADRAAIHPTSVPCYLQVQNKFGASADHWCVRFAYLCPSALAGFTSLLSAAFRSALGTAFGGALAGSAFRHGGAFLGAAFGCALACTAFSRSGRLTLSCVGILGGHRQSQGGGRQGGQRGQFQSCFHIRSFVHEWLKSRWLIASSTTKRGLEAELVRGFRKIFLILANRFASTPPLRVKPT